jgi:N-terminal half of MaoC dehydratase
MACMPIEWGKIREYAVATANSRPEYLDDPHAPIPPTFLSTVVFWDSLDGILSVPDAEKAFEDLGIEADVRRLLSAEQAYVFHGAVPVAGDTLFTSTRFDGIEVKEGRRGRMVFVHFAVEFRDEHDELVAECLYTSVYLTDVPMAS